MATVHNFTKDVSEIIPWNLVVVVEVDCNTGGVRELSDTLSSFKGGRPTDAPFGSPNIELSSKLPPLPLEAAQFSLKLSDDSLWMEFMDGKLLMLWI